jgi:hypothetical protein
MTGHGGRRRLAVRSRNTDPEFHAHQLAQHFAAGDDGNTERGEPASVSGLVEVDRRPRNEPRRRRLPLDPASCPM